MVLFGISQPMEMENVTGQKRMREDETASSNNEGNKSRKMLQFDLNDEYVKEEHED